jgi:hypothetical protein
VSKAPDDWEGQLKAAGLAARRDEEWRNLRRVSLQAMAFHDLSLAHHDPYSWEDTEDPFEQLKAAVPPEIRRIAELDHRRRTRKEQEKLKQWVETVGVKLAAKLGLRRR